MSAAMTPPHTPEFKRILKLIEDEANRYGGDVAERFYAERFRVLHREREANK